MAQDRPFIDMYYRLLCEAPLELHKFYDNSSWLTRPGADGATTTVTTKQGINEVLISWDKVLRVETLRADFQYPHPGAVMILVTGFLIGESRIKRKFSQAFYLVATGIAYYVVNDIFSYVDDLGSTINVEYNQESKPVADDITNDEAHTADPVQVAETTQVAHRSADNVTSAPEKNIISNDKTNHQSENGERSIAEKEVKIADPKSNSTPNGVAQVAEKASPVVKQDAPKTYASMVNALKENPNPFEVKYVRKAPAKDTVKAPAKDTATAPAKDTAKAPAKDTATAPSSKKSDKISYRSAKGYSVFVRNLPWDATPDQVAAIFKKFGSIKHRGVQVRSYKDQEVSFAFVEFVSLSSMESAIQASPITVNGWDIEVQMKRQNTNSGERSRGGFQNGNVPHGGSEGRGNGKEGQVKGNGNGVSRVYQNGGAAPQTAKAQTK